MEYIDRRKQLIQRAIREEREQEHWNEVHNQLLAIQKKSLAISDPKDADEKEADEVARKVVDGQSAEIHGTGGTINRKGEGAAETTPEFQSRLEGSKGGGQSLPENIRQEMGNKMGADFSGVKIHTGSEAHSMSASINAKAFTHGQDIYFNQNHSPDNKELLAHELVHTVQQTGKLMRSPGTIPDVIKALNAAKTAGNMPEYMDVLRNENGKYSEDPTIYAEISAHYNDLASPITLKEAWQAVCILNYGDDVENKDQWPVQVKNFFEGIILGTYTVTTMPPLAKDEIIGMAVQVAHDAATIGIAGARNGPFIEYQGKFNSLWVQSGYSTAVAGTDEFAPTLNSKGPRTQHARFIFNHLYTTDAKVKKDYDTDVLGIKNEKYKMRELVDQYVGPESINLIASPRLLELRKTFYKQATITSTSKKNQAYVDFLKLIEPQLQLLDIDDREVIKTSQEWRIIIEKTVTDIALQKDLMNQIQAAFTRKTSASTSAIIGVGTAKSTSKSSGAVVTPAVTTVHPALTPDQQDFVDNLVMLPASKTITVHSDQTTIEIQVMSSRDPAGLSDIKTVIDYLPVKDIYGTGQTIEEWANLSSFSGPFHRSTVYTEKGTGSTAYTATLKLQYADGTDILPKTPLPTETITVIDDRENYFKTNMLKVMKYYIENDLYAYPPGTVQKFEYFSNMFDIEIIPRFSSKSIKNPPGFPVSIIGKLKQNGTQVWTKTDEMASGQNSKYLDTYHIRPKLNPDVMELTVQFINLQNSSSPFYTITENFTVVPDTNTTPMSGQLGNLLTQLQADYADLNHPITPMVGGIKPPQYKYFLDDMYYYGTPQQKRIAEAVVAGKIFVEPGIIRPDSTSYIQAMINSTSSPASYQYLLDKRAWAYGHTKVDVAPKMDNTTFDTPGLGGWHFTNKLPNTVFVVLTQSLDPLTRSTNWQDGINILTHESLHMLDTRPDKDKPIERYKTEFRAYWMDGERDYVPGTTTLYSTSFDPTMDSYGPKSEKSRVIFDWLYGSDTYSFVKKNYDANIDGFRDQVNAFIVPDGINLPVSTNIDDLRAMVSKLTGIYVGSKAQAAIQAKYATLDLDETQAISGSRYWRTLVESRKLSATDTIALKNDLHIPI